MTKVISSRENAWFKRVHTAARKHDHEIVIEGEKMVADAIAAGGKPIVVACRSPVAGRREFLAPVIEFGSKLFDAVSDTRTPQGVLALFERPAPRDLFARRDTIVVALDGVQDPGNVGTIVRLAAAFDAGGVALLPGCADPFSPKAIRASAGTVLNVPVAAVTAADLLEHRLFAA